VVAHLTFCHSNENCTYVVVIVLRFFVVTVIINSSTHTHTSHPHTHTILTHTHTVTPALIALFSTFFLHFFAFLLTIPSLCFSFLHLFALHTLRRDFFACVCVCFLHTCVCVLHRKIYNAIEYANIAYLSCRQIHIQRFLTPSLFPPLPHPSLSHTVPYICNSRDAYAYVCVCLLLLGALHCDCCNFRN